jgi:hypothetical protein
VTDCLRNNNNTNDSRWLENSWLNQGDSAHSDIDFTMRPRSLLTRQVFRAIIANRPYHTVVCPLRTVTSRHHVATAPSRAIQRRGIFGLTFGQPKDLLNARSSPQNFEIALGKLSEYIEAKRYDTRPPPDQELVNAWRFLFATRDEQEKALTRNEVLLATVTFKYLIARDQVLNGDLPKCLTEQDLITALSALAQPRGQLEMRTDHCALATLIYERARQADDGISTDLEALYINVLSSSGAAAEIFASSEAVIRASPELWIPVLKGLIHEGYTEKVMQLSKGGRLSASDEENALIYGEVIKYLCQRDQPVEAYQAFRAHLRLDQPLPTAGRGVDQTWDGAFYTHQPPHGQLPADALIPLIQTCLEHGELMLADSVAPVLRHHVSEPGVRGAIAAWIYASGVDEDGKAFSDLPLLNQEDMNQLYRFLYSTRSKMSNEERELHHRRASVEGSPGAEGIAYKLNYEIHTGDIAAAKRSFNDLLHMDIPEGRPDVAALNQLIIALSQTNAGQQIDFTTMMRVVDHIRDTGADLSPASLAVLCGVLLRRNELEDVLALVRYRVESLSKQERSQISKVFQDYIVDLSVPGQQAFHAYDIFRHAFPETPPAERLPLMHSFFARKRSDRACLVFGHMRQRQEVEARPDDEAYAQCLYGIAQARDVDGLQMVYNMLKMDIHVEQTTKLHNAMMAAWVACQTPFRSIIDHFWKILDSREGPTLSSFMLALRACEHWIGAGGEEARRIMALMQDWNLVITKEVYDCYIGALAGQSQFENTIELIDHMEEDIGERPDAITIGTFYNAIPWQYRKDEVEAWAKKIYPDLWEELTSYGDTIDEEWEVRYFNINRDIDVDDELLFPQGEYSPQLAEDVRLGLPSPAQSVDNEAIP